MPYYDIPPQIAVNKLWRFIRVWLHFNVLFFRGHFSFAEYQLISVLSCQLSALGRVSSDTFLVPTKCTLLSFTYLHLMRVCYMFRCLCTMIRERIIPVTWTTNNYYEIIITTIMTLLQQLVVPVTGIVVLPDDGAWALKRVGDRHQM